MRTRTLDEARMLVVDARMRLGASEVRAAETRALIREACIELEARRKEVAHAGLEAAEDVARRVREAEAALLAAQEAWRNAVAAVRAERRRTVQQVTSRRRRILDHLERQGGRSHGLVETGRAVDPHGSGSYGAAAIRRAEAAGLVRVEPCTHGVPQALDVVLA